MFVETFTRAETGLIQTLTGGTIYFVAIPLLAGDVATNMSITFPIAGTAMTLSKVGLYDSSGNRLAISADQGAAWAVAGTYTVPFITPYRAGAAGLYYLAVVANGGVLPNIARLNTLTTATLQAVAIGSGALPMGTLTGQTDLPATAAITAGIPIGYWAGLS
jgi:hypothetical protein